MELGKLAGADIVFDERTARLDVTGLTANSADVRPGYVFVAIAGSRADGARFAPDAVRRGAVAVVAAESSQVEAGETPVLRVSEPRRALARMAARLHPRQPQTMVAVTGTAGKTSVASFARQLWEQEGRRAASIGTTGVAAPGLDRYGSLTTPDPVYLHQLLDELAGAAVTHAAMEASSHGLDQYRLDGVRLAAGAFTNLGRDHMDYHPTVEAYFAAKMRLFAELLPAGAPAVIHADDARSEEVAAVAGKAGLRVLTVGRKGTFLTLKRVEHERFRQIGEVHMGDAIFRVEFPLAGDFQLANGLVAAGLAIATGSAPADVMRAMEHLAGAPGRLELVGQTRFGAPVYVDYAHKPEAMEQMLSSLRPFVTGKLLVVFGCGGDRDPGKRPIMGEIAARLADRVVVTDDNPRSENPISIREAILAGCPEAMEIGDRRKAIETAIAMLDTGDALVIAGKGHEDGQIIGSETLPFSDRAVAAETLARGAPAEFAP